MTKTDLEDVREPQRLFTEYSELTNKFIQACHSFDSFRNEILKFKPEIKQDPMLNWHLEFEAIHKLNFCLFVVAPKQESTIEITKVRNSTEFIKDVARSVLFVMNAVEVYTNSKTVSQDPNFIQVRKQFMEIEKAAGGLEATILNAMQSDDATLECSNYHKSILDMRFISGILDSVARKINEDSIKGEESVGGISVAINTIKDRVDDVSKIFKGKIAHFGTLMLESLDKLSNIGGKIIKEGVDKVLSTFISLSANFLDLVQTLTVQMFKFLTQLGSIAKAKGFTISKIDVKIPSVKFEPVPVFGFSIPLSKLESPEILLNVDTKSI